MRTCYRHYPGRSDEACSLVPLHRPRPSLCNSQVGSCNCFFGACSAFTHVMACTLAESPSDPLHRKLRPLRCLRCRFDCYRVERTSSRAGVAPAEVQRLSRRTVMPTSFFRRRIPPTNALRGRRNRAESGRTTTAHSQAAFLRPGASLKNQREEIPRCYRRRCLPLLWQHRVMPGYYTERLAAERLRACYDLATPRTKAYLEAEIEFVLAKTTPSTLALELGCGYGRVLERLLPRVRVRSQSIRRRPASGWHWNM